MELKDAKDAVDHLVLGVNDLQSGIKWFEQQTGVRPMSGGSHPGKGTQNALVSLGNDDCKQYLEIIAPDPQQTEHELAAELLTLATPRLVLWASATIEMEVITDEAKAAGFITNGPADGSRKRPDGNVLKWQLLNVARETEMELRYFNLLPFFIQWDKDSLHPSQDSPAGCQLISLEFAHPDAEVMTTAMNSLGIKASIIKASAPAIMAVLQTPKGNVKLT